MDYKIFKAINRLAGHFPPLDALMIFISNKIRYVYMGVLVFTWFKNKKMTVNVLISVLVGILINTIIKAFCFKPRPYMKHRVGILLPSKNDSTVLSKHTLLVFAVSTSILFRDRFLGTIMTAFSIITGFSRIWLGLHYPSDVIKSAFTGSIISMLVERIQRFKNTWCHDPKSSDLQDLQSERYFD
ncbi:undecaprenyl-diphosphatase [Halalkalibacter flavus]|uniref:undecaprenyl-diphosphatase n=1 Tax=Halalkalibacter flavus TaxID=3090668 RepID=UPI002FC7F2AB